MLLKSIRWKETWQVESGLLLSQTVHEMLLKRKQCILGRFKI